ncbi:helix-turn-helix transcriptional regulator [Flavobacteriaceae bacterium TP-CH-4]|uniref:Helix-turn-helix transcriptional regulator n=2 Tax=Pelagihabitans pacificus TaxID=2696054 RepID=A0A967E9B3_9FLAO|nr:helix-turn-helix transcriptional regulator [Pelagihabitans pacificus]
MNFLLIAGAVQGFIFSVVIFLTRRKVEKPVVFLNLLVFFLSLNNLQSWLITKGLVIDQVFFKHFEFPWYVLILPMFYAFLIHYLGIEKKRMPFLGPTITVFIGELLARSIFLFQVYQGRYDPETIPMYNAIEDTVTLLYSLFIFGKAVRIVFKYQELYPTILTFDDLNWIKRFIKWGAVIFLLWGIAVVLNIFSETIKAPYSYYPLRIASSVLLYWIGYQAFFRYVVLKDRIVLRREMRKNKVNESIGAIANAKDTKLGKQEIEFKKIQDHVVGQQRYIDSSLSLEKLSEELNMGTSKLSALINQYSGHNFSDYVNGLRVEDAKRLLANPDFENYTIVSIGLECGFNSKSTFYSAFNKFTGHTPSEYRKQFTRNK